MMSRSKILLGLTTLLAVSACSSVHIDDGQYWQRISVSDAAYTEGPKAQQMLDRDISRCVVELRELEGLGAIKDAIPTDHAGKLLDPDEKKLSDWDTPERDGHLLAEHTDYQDFDGCMRAKGWDRVKYVPYKVADTARHNWFISNVDYGADPADAPINPPVKDHDYND